MRRPDAFVFSQVEYCDNLIFHRRAALDKMGERLLDANRTIGQPNKITVIFGRKRPDAVSIALKDKITKQYRGKLQTEIEDMHLPNPVVRSHYRHGFIPIADGACSLQYSVRSGPTCMVASGSAWPIFFG
jgi:hypothetical protein